MGYAIIRVAKRTARPSVRGMLRHALREAEVANAVPGQAPEVLAGDRSSGAALARLSAALKAAPKVRKDTVQALDVLVTASHDDMLSWPRERQDAYFRKALDFVAARFGGRESVLTAAIHRDESTPHMQILIMPRDPETGSFVAGRMIGGPAGLRQMHDDFHEQVGRDYGLMRGERGTDVQHVPIRQFYAAIKASSNPLPDYVAIPPAPTWPEKLLGKGKAMTEARKSAISKNAAIRNQIAARAKAAGQLAPAMLARQAARYRAALKAEDAAKVRLEATNIVRAEAEATLKRVEKVTNTANTWAYLEAFADASRRADPRYVARLASQLGIQLKPGLNLVDQVRKASSLTGPGAAMAAAARLDEAAAAVGVQPIGEALMRQDPDGPELSPQPPLPR